MTTQVNRLIVLAVLLPLLASAERFYADDPLWTMPAPVASSPAPRGLSDAYDYFLNTFAGPAEKGGQSRPIPAQAVNTLGEVPDSAWFTNRIGARRMTREELLRGPGDGHSPREGTWAIVSAKTEGLTPGFLIEDSSGERYVLKFDPASNPEMASAADFLGSRFFHALGYNVPENYIVEFFENRLRVGEGATVLEKGGKKRPMRRGDVERVLKTVSRQSDGSIRALASRLLKGEPLGGFRYHGTRSDDTNDIYRHEHRRDLRGLYVFCSWLGHDDSRAINTLDMLVGQAGRQFVRHYLIDFGSILGSASEEPNSPRGGNQHLYEAGRALTQIVTLGMVVPRWQRWDYSNYPSIGRFEWEIYQPDKWKPEYRNPAFENRLPDDTYWAAKKVMAFSDDDIRALVERVHYSDKSAEEWLITCLRERRDKIGAEYFRRVLPLDSFAVSEGRLLFEHLGEKYGLFAAPDIHISWSRLDNDTGNQEPIEGPGGSALPQALADAPPASYYVAQLTGDSTDKTVSVSIRKQNDGFEIVGVDRAWR